MTNRPNFIAPNEFLIIQTSWKEKGCITEAPCGVALSIDEVIEWTPDNCEAIFRAGPEGFEDITSIVAAHYIETRQIGIREDCPDVPWLEDIRDELPSESEVPSGHQYACEALTGSQLGVGVS